MNEKQLSQAMNSLAEELVPGDVDIWPTIQMRYQVRNCQRLSRNPEMTINPTRYRRLRLATTSLLILSILSLLLIATPQGKVLAQEVLRFFSRAGNDNLQIHSIQLTGTPLATVPDPASILDAHQSINEVEKQAGFDVLEPTYIPEILSFSGASIETEHHIVRIFYLYDKTNGLVLREESYERTEDCVLCGKVGASASVKTVQIGNATGEYVEGVWKLTDNGQIWDPDPYLKTLRWQVNAMAFELQYMGPADTLTQADMVAIAKSLK